MMSVANTKNYHFEGFLLWHDTNLDAITSEFLGGVW